MQGRFRQEGNPLHRPDIIEQTKVRMTEANPMKDLAVRAKVSRTLQAMGHGPSVRKGNGTGLTECEQLLADQTGFTPLAVGVPTWLRRELSVAPKNYKIDLAHAKSMLAVEIDGMSHRTTKRQEQDARKDMILARLGWRVVRVTNEEVKADLDGVATRLLSMTSK